MAQYKLHNYMGSDVSVTRLADGVSIPFDPDNTDYQQYLKWLEEGNTPLPADPQPE
jgi:hypothetical protein